MRSSPDWSQGASSHTCIVSVVLSWVLNSWSGERGGVDEARWCNDGRVAASVNTMLSLYIFTLCSDISEHNVKHRQTIIMASQTLFTASPSTTLDLGGNITTGDIILGNEQTIGNVYIGSGSRTTGGILIGATGQIGQTLVQGGPGGVFIKSSIGSATLRSDAVGGAGGETNVLSNGSGAHVTNIDALTSGTINIGATQTTGTINIGDAPTRTGTITIGHASNAGNIDLLTNGQLILSGGSTGVDIDATSGGTISIDAGGGIDICTAVPNSNPIIIGTQGNNTGPIRLGAGGAGGDIDLRARGAMYIGDGNASGVMQFHRGVGNITFNTSGTLQLGSTSTSTVELKTSATGTVKVGDDQTSGTLTIGANAARTSDITIGNATNSGNVEVVTTGNINLTADKLRVLGTAQATTLTNGSAEYKGGIGVTKNIVVGENIILGQDLRADDLTRNLLMFNGNTSGSIAMGGGMTTADISFGSATQTGQIKILPTTPLLLSGDINSAVISRNVQIFSANTSGDISLGAGLTTGVIKLGSSGQSGVNRILNTSDASATNNGALAVDGGMSVAKRFYCGSGIWLGNTKSTTTQTTSITNGVNTGGLRYGRIVTVVASAITSHIFAEFTWTNSLISTESIILFSTIYNSTGNGHPLISLTSQGSGTAVVRIQNVANGTLDAAITINYMIV